jgi:galactokinase/mevalonate kinase-like predicted kinase
VEEHREVIRLMNKAEAALYAQAQQMNAAAEKLKADITKIDAKHHANSMEIDQKAEARLASKISEDALDRAGGYVERRVAENAMQPQALGTKDAQYHSTAQFKCALSLSKCRVV